MKRNTLVERTLRVAVVFVMVFSFVGSGIRVDAFDGGDGSVGAPYQISSCLDLQSIADDLGANYELISSVDCDSVVMEPIGTPGTPFTGTLDGNGHEISNINISSVTDNSGIFGGTSNAIFSNLYLDNITISGTNIVGALIGISYVTELSRIALSNSNITGTGQYVGGIVGYLGGSSIVKSYAESTVVTGDEFVGGISGITIGPSAVSQSYFQGTVNGATTVGGITGQVGAGPAYVTETYADVVFTNAGSDVVDTIGSGASASSNFIASAPYLENNTQTPLDAWDFDETWYVRTNDYPAIRPVTMPSYLCLETTVTYTTLTASCQIERDLGIGATWELQYSKTDKNEWTSLPGQSGQSFTVTATGLEQSTRYTLRFRYTTSIGIAEWGTVQGRTDGDLNGDSIADSTQPNIGGYESTKTGKFVAIDVGEGCELTTDDMTTEDNLSIQDAAYNYDNGLWDFEADCTTPGYTTTIKLYYYNVNKSGLVLRKHNPNTKTFFNINDAVFSNQTINNQDVTVVTYQITEGGERDTDGVTDGVINDPVGLASLVVAVPNTGLGGIR